MPEIKAWSNTVGQQVENMTVDLVATTAANVSEASGDVFFVGRPAQNGQDWILKKITPTELEKMVYNYLTSSSIASQLAAVLGAIALKKLPDNTDLDTVFTGGAYFVPSRNMIHKPENYGYHGVLLVYRVEGYIMQVFIGFYPGVIYTRGYATASSSWIYSGGNNWYKFTSTETGQ